MIYIIHWLTLQYSANTASLIFEFSCNRMFIKIEFKLFLILVLFYMLKCQMMETDSEVIPTTLPSNIIKAPINLPPFVHPIFHRPESMYPISFPSIDDKHSQFPHSLRSKSSSNSKFPSHVHYLSHLNVALDEETSEPTSEPTKLKPPKWPPLLEE